MKPRPLRSLPAPGRSRSWCVRRGRPPLLRVAAAPLIRFHHAIYFLHRQYQGKTGTVSGATGDFEGTAVLGDDLLDNGEADPGAHLARFLGLLGAVELLENLADFFLIHSDALILDRDADAVAVALGEDGDFRR